MRLPQPRTVMIWPAFVPAFVGVLAFHMLAIQVLMGPEFPILERLAHVNVLGGILYVAVAIWSFIVARRALDPATGTGFTIAASGLLLRLLVGYEAWVDLFVRRDDATIDPALSLRLPAEILGTFAYGFGLAMVAIATWGAWRERLR